jgi:hypothetical protein
MCKEREGERYVRESLLIRCCLPFLYGHRSERERERERKKERKRASHKEFLVMYPH